MNKKLKTGLLIPIIGLSYPVFAEDDTIKNSDDVMVVTASAIEQRLKDAPASISVITAEELERNIVKSSTDLADILSRAAGVSKSINSDVGSGIQIRGMPAAYTLLLIDGKRIGSSNSIKTIQQNYFDDINWLPVESIERIEIVRGPMSSLYGSDAMGGVVNIITKKNSKTAWHGSLAVGTRQPKDSNSGDTNTWTGTVSGPLGNGFDLRLNGSWNKRNADTSDTESLRYGSGVEGKELTNYGAELGWDITETQRVAFSTQQGTEKGLQGTNNTSDLVALRGITRLERENYTINYQGIFDFGSAKLSAYENKFKNTNISTTSPGNQWFREHIVEGDINVPFELLLPQSMTVGGQWKKQEVDNPRDFYTGGNNTLPTKAKVTSKGIFVEDQIDLLDDVALTLGLRRDNTDFGNKTTPRAYLVWNATENLTIKGGYSEGFKTPSMREAYLIGSSNGRGCEKFAAYNPVGNDKYYNNSTCEILPNPNLKPEQSDNWEIGALYDNAGWSAGLTFFDNKFKDKIATAPLGYNGKTVINNRGKELWVFEGQYINLNTAHTQGIEGNLTIPLISEPKGPWLQQLSLSNNFTRMIKAEDSLGVLLVTTPKLTMWSALDWQINNKLGVEFNAQYYSKMLGLDSKDGAASAHIREAYTVYGLSGQYKATKNLKFNVGIDNLFDTQPATSENDYYIPGQVYYASMTATF